VTLHCKHNVKPEKLYKVTWLKGNSKVFEYINGRLPPYRNFSVPGAEIDVRVSMGNSICLPHANLFSSLFFLPQHNKSNQHEVTLKSLDFDATGLYNCEVSLESPIFTKASNEEQVQVIRECYWLLITQSGLTLRLFFAVPQNAPPSIVFKKRQFYVGEKLVANCSTSRSKPLAHIVWLINGKKVNI
jgi:CD80-like C2-set immunoglobulin domain